MKFYTNVKRRKGKLYVRGYDHGLPYKEVIDYKPYIFVRTNEEAEYKTIYGQSVGKLQFDSIGDYYEYAKRYEGVSGHKIYGLTDFEYTYIYDNFPDEFEYDFNLLNVVSLDLETDSSQGYGDPQKADKPITMITLTTKGRSITFGLKDYDKEVEGRTYIKCGDEQKLLAEFIKYWNRKEWLPDIVLTWNGEFYDIPYLINRIILLFSEKYANRLSPFGFITERTAIWKDGKEFKTYDIAGVTHIDYMAAYKKFSPNEKESYRLNFISEVELKEKKVDYSQYGSLNDLYEKNFNLFVDYNIQDSFLIDKLEAKLHFVEQMVSIAYVERVNFEDTLKTVKPWDVLIHNYLMNQKIVISPFVMSDDDRSIIGGYVKEPIPGMYKWVASVDFTSLYPSLAMQYNISSDSFFKKFDFKPSVEEIMGGDISEFTEELVKRNLCMTPNGCLYKRDSRGFFPTILKKFFDGRKVYKKKMIAAKKELELIEEEIERRNVNYSTKKQR